MKFTHIGIVVIRVVLGVIFFAHGLSKFQGGIDNTAGFFTSLGLPGFSAYLVAGIELIGGALIILGLATRIIAALFAAIMVVAIATVSLQNGLVGGFEFDLSLLAMSLLLVLNKEQAYSVDNVILSSRKKEQNV
ncbi:DoxX family protein [Niallia taxi]|mgnify:CR=1 FL=1|uniref:DoxX family protein n=1 Tax=Niallia taxi TaxID=2499688 RepID=A0A437K342_9BACI|nr:DoxX family protein [Niallia taxi]MCM3214526.1 DoxX family protein [Niallia taxi]MCT2346351.1 DoxX family protein [Niallia taxi]MDE5051710.1 DoxX family protein [Niallia taxi]MDK8643551.1 DoxX family protein [Niallia taxi]MED3964984.1 DoxX family protein [Niallia taxi]